MRFALVSRELAPFDGGGIAPLAANCATLLAPGHEVTIVTSANHREAYARLRARGDARLWPDSVRMVFVEKPTEETVGPYLSHMHAWSGRVYEALRAAYPDRGPDFVEFPDYLGEAFVTVQARHTHDPWLRDTTVAVRLHTSAEMATVLDATMGDDVESVAVFEAERYCLRHADRLLWCGGDVLETYRRYYRADALAPAELVPDAFTVEMPEDPGVGRLPVEGEPLKLLYLGRLERRKGVQNLMRAVSSLGTTDFRLAMLGGDTDTAPLRASMREVLGLHVAGDWRVEFLPRVAPGEVVRHIDEADLVVLPSLWECWPNVAREALMRNRPVLATPVGGFCEMIEEGVSGYLAEDTSPEAIARCFEALVHDRERLASMIRSRGPRKAFERITDPARTRRRYEEVAALEPRTAAARPRRRVRPPLVSIVVPYFRLDEHVVDTIDSALAQTHEQLEVIVVNDGSLREQDGPLYDLADRDGVQVITQANSGLSAARNTGIRHASGEYVLPLDADDVILPSFLERCLHPLERDGDLAYAGTWVRYMTPDGEDLDGDGAGYVPFGNWSRLIDRNNVAGNCSVVLRRRLFDIGFAYSPDLASYEDWFLYRELHHAGHHGAIVPERLFRYRVRKESMIRTDGLSRTEPLVDEMRALLRERSMRWQASLQ
jgi:glycogen(starch) synthase